jgi:hypothetical protein
VVSWSSIEVSKSNMLEVLRIREVSAFPGKLSCQELEVLKRLAFLFRGRSPLKIFWRSYRTVLPEKESLLVQVQVVLISTF